MKNIDYHAQLVIYDLPSFKKITKGRLIKWLETLTREIKKEKDMKIYAKRFTLRLMK